jgi:hypothetical protein
MAGPYFSCSDLLFLLITCLLVSIIIGLAYLFPQHFHELCNYMHLREDFGMNSTVRFHHRTEDDEHEGDISLINLFPLPPPLSITRIPLYEHEIITPPPAHR